MLLNVVNAVLSTVLCNANFLKGQLAFFIICNRSEAGGYQNGDDNSIYSIGGGFSGQDKLHGHVFPQGMPSFTGSIYSVTDTRICPPSIPEPSHRYWEAALWYVEVKKSFSRLSLRKSLRVFLSLFPHDNVQYSTICVHK